MMMAFASIYTLSKHGLSSSLGNTYFYFGDEVVKVKQSYKVPLRSRFALLFHSRDRLTG